MNEYLIEDEYSYYEIDSECTAGFSDMSKEKSKLKKTNQKEEILLKTDGCREKYQYDEKKKGNNRYFWTDGSLLLLWFFFLKNLYRKMA